MQEAAHQLRTPQTTRKSRRQEIERCLVESGLMRLRHFRYRADTASYDDAYGRRLNRALTRLGPVFSMFGLYLSSRGDLLPVQNCLELATLPDQTSTTPRIVVREILKGELGKLPEAIFSVFEYEPIESRLLSQTHRALLKDGTAVAVKILHPEVQEQLAVDLELIPILQTVLLPDQTMSQCFKEAVDDFRSTLQWQSNMTNIAQAYEELVRDAQAFDTLTALNVHKPLCSTWVLTLEEVTGTSLEAILALFDQGHPEGHRQAQEMVQELGFVSRDLARLIYLVWLRQAFMGQQVPIALHPRDVLLLPNKQIAFMSDAFTKPSADTKQHLWRYLSAVNTETPDNACYYLLQEVDPTKRSIDHEEELRYRFREVVPFRDSDWSGNNDRLLGCLFVHWRLLSERDLSLNPHALGFYRGLFQAATAVSRIPTHGDPFLDGLRDLQVLLIMKRYQDTFTVQQFSDNLEKYATILIGLPQYLDHALTSVAKPSVPEQHQHPQGTTASWRQHNASAMLMTLLLLLGALVLVSRHLTTHEVGGVWVETISTALFVILGGLVLRAVRRPR